MICLLQSIAKNIIVLEVYFEILVNILLGVFHSRTSMACDYLVCWVFLPTACMQLSCHHPWSQLAFLSVITSEICVCDFLAVYFKWNFKENWDVGCTCTYKKWVNSVHSIIICWFTEAVFITYANMYKVCVMSAHEKICGVPWAINYICSIAHVNSLTIPCGLHACNGHLRCYTNMLNLLLFRHSIFSKFCAEICLNYLNLTWEMTLYWLPFLDHHFAAAPNYSLTL